MSLDKAGGPPKRRRTADKPAPSLPHEVGEESPNPLPDAELKHGPDPARGGQAERDHTEEQLDRGLEETFPASDPVSIQGDR
jgi:hypothetical protein